MKFSLILGVYGHQKHEYLRRFLRSLRRQGTADFELVVVDQNTDDQIEKLLDEERGEYRLVLLKSKPGLSRARNVGLQEARGAYVCFPDDDCEYPEGLLKAVANFFENNADTELLAIDTRDTETGKKLPYTKKAYGEFVMNRTHVFKCVTSISIFCKNERAFRFDERLGLGAEFPSCEEFDFATSYFKAGKKAFFTDKLHVMHPDHTDLDTTALIRKIKIHAPGHGAYFRKHFFFLFPSAVYNLLIAPVGGMAKSALTWNSRMFSVYSTFLQTRIIGFLRY